MSRPSRKRFKKSHGPDFVENFDSAIFEDLQEDQSNNRCDYCLSFTCNRNGKPENLLICKDCNAKAHPTCMDYSPELAKRSRMSPWQCIDCKTCCICEEAEDADCMLFCDLCDKGYHENCHKPKISEKPQGKWVCQKCRDDTEKPPEAKTIVADGIYGINVTNVMSLHKKESEHQDAAMDTSEVGMIKCTVDGASGLPTPCDSPVPETLGNKQSSGTTSIHVNKNFFNNKENISMANVPDATEWSIADVEKYFCSVGFSDQAKAFGEQEIDGKSLLLMKRSDVLTGLALKLGPALKIYNYVKQLQLKHVDESDDF